jgi:hypothetical protein
LEHRRHSGARRRTRRLDVKTKAKASVDITMSLPNIENLITDGDITLGVYRLPLRTKIDVWLCWSVVEVKPWCSF